MLMLRWIIETLFFTFLVMGGLLLYGLLFGGALPDGFFN